MQPTDTATPDKHERRTALLLFLVLAVTYGYIFHSNPLDNVYNRLDLAYAVVYDHSLTIDKYAANTVDKAYYDGHYYCSQAIGSVVPAVAVLGAYRLLSGDTTPNPAAPVPLYLITFLIVGLPSALFAVLFFYYLRRLSLNPMPRYLVTLAIGIGTLIMPYSTLFYSYMPALLLCFAAFVMIEDRRQGNKEFTPGSLIGIGLLLGAAAITSYDTICIAIPLTVYCFLGLRQRARFIYFLLGATPPLALMGAYNAACFGSPLSFGIFHVAVPEWQQGARTVSYLLHVPKPLTLLKVLFHPGRGLFWLSPFLLFCVPGLVHMFRDRDRRALAWLIVGIAALFLYYVGYFPDPMGGLSPGPRYLTTLIPFLAIPMFIFLLRHKNYIFGLSMFSAMWIFKHSFLITITNPHVPKDIIDPAYSYAIYLAYKGIVADNLGSLFGLTGLLSLIPLLLFYIIYQRFLPLERKDRKQELDKKASKPIIRSIWIFGFIYCAMHLASLFILMHFDSHNGNIRRGAVYAEHGLYKDAIEEYSGEIRWGEGADPALLLGRANAYLAMGESDKALRDYEWAAECEPGNTSAHHNAAQLLKHRNKQAEAAEHYRLLLKSHPEPEPLIAFEAHFTMGADLMQRQDFMAAVPHLEKAVTLRPDYAPALESLAYAQAKSKDLKAARDTAKKLIRIDPQNNTARWILDSLE